MNSTIVVSESGAIAQENNTSINIIRGLNKAERKNLGAKQSTLKAKVKKMDRLNKKKAELKQTLKRGYRIVVSTVQKEEVEQTELKKTHPSLNQIDRLEIKDKITKIDIELFDVKAEIKNLKKEISSKRKKSIKSKKAELLKRKAEKAETLSESETLVEEQPEVAQIEEAKYEPIPQIKDESTITENNSPIALGAPSKSRNNPVITEDKFSYLDGSIPVTDTLPESKVEQGKEKVTVSK